MPECRSPFNTFMINDVSTTPCTTNVGGVGLRRHSGILLAVGTGVTPAPPHRPQRAELPH